MSKTNDSEFYAFFALVCIASIVAGLALLHLVDKQSFKSEPIIIETK